MAKIDQSLDMEDKPCAGEAFGESMLCMICLQHDLLARLPTTVSDAHFVNLHIALLKVLQM